jgi:hypothetical protein
MSQEYATHDIEKLDRIPLVHDATHPDHTDDQDGAEGAFVALAGAPVDGGVPTYDAVTGKHTSQVPSGGGGGQTGVGACFDGGANPLNLLGTTQVVCPPVKGAQTIAKATITVSSGPGAATVRVKKCAPGSFPGGLTDITAGANIPLVSAHYYEDTTLTGWTLAVNDNDIFVFELLSVSGGVKMVTVLLEFA